MENTLHASSHADHSPALATPRPALQQCVVPVAPTCFLLDVSAGANIADLCAYIREIARTYHAYGAANITFIVSDLHALQLGGFFLPDNQRAMVGELPIVLCYMFASEAGVVYSSNNSLRTLTYWAKYFAKEWAR